MSRIAEMVIRHKKAIIVIFMVATAVCAALFFMVRVNYNMTQYLPQEAQSTKALVIMSEEFTQTMPNSNVFLRDVTIPEALMFKHMLMGLEHVDDVVWLDDMVDLTRPLEMGDIETIELYYSGGNALYSVAVRRSYEKEGITEIRGLLGERGTVTGDAADVEYVQTATGKEVKNAIIILLPIILFILIVSTSSWIEPLLFIAAIGVSVIINMGTNAFYDDVSFLTNAVTPILQLAVSLDYAIFLLHSFGSHRQSGSDVEDAMRKAIKESFSSVAASASTTLFGFMALLFMDFKLGADLGLSLAKGILFSFISVMVFLPALTMYVYKVIDKTKHKEFIPTFSNIYKALRVFAIPVAVLIAVVIVPCFLGQSKTSFSYGYQAAAAQMRNEELNEDDVFGKSSIMVLLVPRGEVVREELLCDELLSLGHVTSLMSYAKTVGSGIPPEFLDSSITDQFYSENLARVVLYLDTLPEGDVAFRTVEEISAITERYYPKDQYVTEINQVAYEGAYSAGYSANLYDIKTVVQKDNMKTNLIAIGTIFLVLLITFKSLALPFFLLLTIESAIWINLSIPYFTGISINYIGYLVLNTVQLGATVDYAILLTVTYMRNRQNMGKHEAMHVSLGSSFKSILVSAVTLATAGFTLMGTSSNPLIADIGMLLGRGTLLSMLTVVVFLPAMLVVFDGLIGRTTLKAGFYKSLKRRDGDVL